MTGRVSRRTFQEGNQKKEGKRCNNDLKRKSKPGNRGYIPERNSREEKHLFPRQNADTTLPEREEPRSALSRAARGERCGGKKGVSVERGPTNLTCRKRYEPGFDAATGGRKSALRKEKRKGCSTSWLEG